MTLGLIEATALFRPASVVCNVNVLGIANPNRVRGRRSIKARNLFRFS